VPGARPDDGRLRLLLAGRFSRVGALQMLPALMRGRHLPHPQLHTCAFRLLHLQAKAALPLAADGEAMRASAEVQVRVLPAALQVVGWPPQP
jgi:diacylglycerol kinase family enzyme